MRPFWTPLSALIVPDPPSFATPALVRLMMRGGRGAELVYAGDRMWPAVRHGQRVVIEPLSVGDRPPDGSVVLGSPAGIPDLFRARSGDEGRIRLGCDADPEPELQVEVDQILGIARLRRATPSRAVRLLRRMTLDLREAARGRPDAEEDPAATVLSKYDAQAPFYASRSGDDMAPALLRWVVERSPAGGRILVAGSGSGRECFALTRSGWTVTGIDFSPEMVRAAEAEAGRRGLSVEFLTGDLRTCPAPAGPFSAIFFTYDVYSFIPGRETRVALLRRMRRWLRSNGVVFLSARRFERVFDPVILTLQRAVRVGERQGSWGASHTRWIASDGSMHRSFVQVFTQRGIHGEVQEAGFRMGDWHGNHCVLTPAPVRESALSGREEDPPAGGSEST